MDMMRSAERLMSMDDAVWARHANPWSVWTRFSCGPLLALAVFSRAWIGWWALIPVALAVFWTWWNPRAFPPPARIRGWASEGVYGERIFLNRAKVPVPERSVRRARLSWALSAIGVLPLVYGLIVLDPWATAIGLVAAIAPKLWFVNDMVHLYREMKDADPAYQAWPGVAPAPEPAP